MGRRLVLGDMCSRQFVFDASVHAGMYSPGEQWMGAGGGGGGGGWIVLPANANEQNEIIRAQGTESLYNASPLAKW